MTGNRDERDLNAPAGPPDLSSEGPPPPRGPLSFLADLVAGIRVGVHVKLLAGYFVGGLLVLVRIGCWGGCQSFMKWLGAMRMP